MAQTVARGQGGPSPPLRRPAPSRAWRRDGPAVHRGPALLRDRPGALPHTPRADQVSHPGPGFLSNILRNCSEWLMHSAFSSGFARPAYN